MAYGVVYIARNDSDPDSLYKIGKTTNLEARLKKLTSETSNVGKYKEVGYVVVSDIDYVESETFKRLERYRFQDNREFFKCDLSEIVSVVRSVSSIHLEKDYLPESSIDVNTIFESSRIGEINSNKASIENTEEVIRLFNEYKRKAYEINDSLTFNIEKSSKNKKILLEDQTEVQLLVDQTFDIPKWIDSIKAKKNFEFLPFPLLEIRLKRRIEPDFHDYVSSPDFNFAASYASNNVGRSDVIGEIIDFLKQVNLGKGKFKYAENMKPESKYIKAFDFFNKNWKNIAPLEEVEGAFQIIWDICKYPRNMSRFRVKSKSVCYCKLELSMGPASSLDEHKNLFIEPIFLLTPKIGCLKGASSLTSYDQDRVYQNVATVINYENEWTVSEEEIEVEMDYQQLYNSTISSSNLDEIQNVIAQFCVQNSLPKEKLSYLVSFGSIDRYKQIQIEIDREQQFSNTNEVIYDSLLKLSNDPKHLENFFKYGHI